MFLDMMGLLFLIGRVCSIDGDAVLVNVECCFRLFTPSRIKRRYPRYLRGNYDGRWGNLREDSFRLLRK